MVIKKSFAGNRLLPELSLAIFFLSLAFVSCGQQNKQMVRLAKLQIDSLQLEAYTKLLKEEIETSLRVEPGVLTLYPLAEKNNPAHITILEIYASDEAYKAHIKTPHFLKYKNGTINMVKSLELVETIPIMPANKIKS
jgi:quinol monooxygenase YgiN